MNDKIDSTPGIVKLLAFLVVTVFVICQVIFRVEAEEETRKAKIALIKAETYKSCCDSK